MSPETRKLLDVTHTRSVRPFSEAQAGATIGDIGAAVQEMVEANGFSVVRDFVGHGIGRSMHEDPQVPNYGIRGKGPRLRVGMVIAIEPMVNAGAAEVRSWKTAGRPLPSTASGALTSSTPSRSPKSGPVILTR